MDGDLARDSGHHFPDLRRLALDRVAEDERAIAGPARHLGRGLERGLRSGDDARFAAGEGRIAGLGSLATCRRRDAPAPREAGRCRSACSTALASASVVVSGVVGPEAITDGSSPGTSEMIKDTILAGAAATRQPAALDRGQMLADAVDLIDVGAAPEQRLVQGLLVVERDPRRRQGKQSRAAARYQAEREVVGAEALDEIEDPAGRVLPRGVGNGMGGLDHLDPLQRADAVAIARDDQAGERLVSRPMRFDRAGHRGRGLAGADDDRAARGRREEGSRAQPCRARPPRSRPRTCPAATAALSSAWLLRPTPSPGRFRGGRAPRARAPCRNDPTPRRLRRRRR